MQIDKVNLTDINRGYLRKLRKDSKRAAEDVSVELGYSKAWLGQIERGLTKTVKRYDLARVMCVYCPEYTPSQILSTGLLDNYMNYGLLVENMNAYLAELREINFADIFYKCIDQVSPKDEKDESFNSINTLANCIDTFPGAMNTLLSQSSILQMILENYSVLPPDMYLSNINSFSRKLTDLLEEELNSSNLLALNHIDNADS